MHPVPMAAAGLAALLGLTAHHGDLLAQKRQRDLITRQEFQESSHKNSDLYQAIRSIRPHFLTAPRGVRSLGAAPPTPIVVYLDGTRQGEIDALKLILADRVEEVRYLEPAKAQDEFGASHSGGALLVKLYKGPPSPPPATPPPPPAARGWR